MNGGIFALVLVTGLIPSAELPRSCVNCHTQIVKTAYKCRSSSPIAGATLFSL